MQNPKILIVLSREGVDSVTVSAPDATSRNIGYEICQSLEEQLSALGEIAKRRLNEEYENEKC